MSERKIELILQWIERNPEKYDEVAAKIKEISKVATGAAKIFMKGAKTDKEEADRKKGLTATTTSYIDAMLRQEPSYKMASDAEKRVEDAQRAEQKQMEANVKSWKTLGSKISSVGTRLGWMGFRMVMMGRVITRYMMQPINQIVNLMKSWDKSMMDLAYTIGILGYTGLGSADFIATLTDTLYKLPEAGLQVQAALGTITGILATLAVDLAPILTPAIVQIAEAFMKVWQQVSPTLIPALQELLDSILPPLISLILEVGPAIVEGFLKGLETILPILVSFLTSLKPILPALGWLLGALLPLAPLFMVIGTAMYFISPLLMAIGAAIGFIAPLLGVTSAGLATFGAAAGAAGAAMVPAIPVILALAAAALAVGAAIAAAGWGFNQAADALLKLVNHLDKLAPLVPILFGLGAGMTLVAAAGMGLFGATAGVTAFSVSVVALTAALFGLSGAIWAVVSAAKAFQAVEKTVDKITKTVGGAISALTDALGSLCFRHATPAAIVFEDVLRDTRGEIARTTSDVTSLAHSLRRVESPGVAAPAGGGGPAYYTIYGGPITIESISGFDNLDQLERAVADSANRGLAELRRRKA